MKREVPTDYVPSESEVKARDTRVVNVNADIARAQAVRDAAVAANADFAETSEAKTDREAMEAVALADAEAVQPNRVPLSEPERRAQLEDLAKARRAVEEKEAIIANSNYGVYTVGSSKEQRRTRLTQKERDAESDIVN